MIPSFIYSSWRCITKPHEIIIIIIIITIIIINHIKASIDKTQLNSKCGDRDETINYIIREYG